MYYSKSESTRKLGTLIIYPPPHQYLLGGETALLVFGQIRYSVYPIYTTGPHRISYSHLHFHIKPCEIFIRSEWICALRCYSIINHNLRKELLNLQETISIRTCSQFPHFLCSISLIISFLVLLHSRHRPACPD